MNNLSLYPDSARSSGAQIHESRTSSNLWLLKGSGKEAMALSASLNSSFLLSDSDLPSDEVIFGCSSAMEAVRLSVDMAATANVPVLLQGESGTGKEILAR